MLFAALLLAFVAMGPFARTVWSGNEIWQGTNYIAGISDIALGCLTALLVDGVQRKKPAWLGARVLLAIQIAGAAMMVLIAFWPPWRWMKELGRTGTDDTALALATCMVILGSVLRGRTGRAWTAPIRWFGRHSYEVYLTHEFVVVWVTMLYVRLHPAGRDWAGGNWGSPLVWIPAEVVLAAPLGWAVARWFSEPMNGWLRGAAGPGLPAK